MTFQYQGLHNNYIDTSQTMSYGKYGSNDYWPYLHAFSDHSTGMTEFITYLTGDNNTHGTPNTGTDNRFDPTYSTIQGGCSGNFANQDDHAWSEQLVNTITIAPTDTNSTSLPSAETTYSYGMATQSGATCAADSEGLTACPVATWYPSGENDWQDYYHGEFRGFSWAYIVSPAGDLTTQNYASTPGWHTAAGRSANYTAGQLYEQDLYQGSVDNPAQLISRTSNVYNKIQGQMPSRGWTNDSIQDALDNPDHTIPVKDIRGGINNPEPATAYFSKSSGGYVVRNDATGDIVQVSNRNDPNWKGS